jgi:hypothetical protein
MTIANYSRTVSTFPSSISLTDSVNLSANILRNAYQYLFEYCDDQGLPKAYFS